MGALDRTFILEQTVIARPRLVPEIALRVVTEGCPLWKAGQKELDRIGLVDPFWAFCWPGGQALARFVLDHPEWVRGKRVLDFGAGCGVVAIAASLSGAAAVCAADIDPLARWACEINAAANGVRLEACARDLLGTSGEGFDVVVAGDMCYDLEMTRRMSAWLADLGRAGKEILFADPRRGYLQTASWLRLARYRTPSEIDSQGKYFCMVEIYSRDPGSE